MTTALSGALMADPGQPSWPSQPPPAPPPAPAPPAPPAGEDGTSWGDAAWGAARGVVPDWMRDPHGEVMTAATEYVKAGIIAVLEEVWAAGLSLLRGSLGLADELTTLNVPATFARGAGSGGLHEVWGAVWWLAIVIAIGLFFAQLIMVAVRGGRGMARAVTGPAQFGLALAFVLSLTGAVVAAADGITHGLLELGLGSGDFTQVVTPKTGQEGRGVGAVFTEDPNLGEGLTDMTRAVIMAFAGIFGSIAAAGFAAELVVRQAIILLLVAVSPIAAAGLVSGVTSSWWWRTARWLAAAILLEPALALSLVIGVGILSSATGIAALLVGAGVLLSSLFCPWAVYKLLAFVDPATGAGTELRSLLSRPPNSSHMPAPATSAAEINTARFDEHARAQRAAAERPGLATRAAGAATAGYQRVAAAGAYAGARLNQQAAQTGVGHPGAILPSRAVPAPRTRATAGSGGGAAADEPPPSSPPAPPDGPLPVRDPKVSDEQAPESGPDRGATDADRRDRDRDRDRERRSRRPGPDPAAPGDRRPPTPPPPGQPRSGRTDPPRGGQR